MNPTRVFHFLNDLLTWWPDDRYFLNTSSRKDKGTRCKVPNNGLLSVMRGLSLRSSFGMPSEAVRKFWKKNRTKIRSPQEGCRIFAASKQKSRKQGELTGPENDYWEQLWVTKSSVDNGGNQSRWMDWAPWWLMSNFFTSARYLAACSLSPKP